MPLATSIPLFCIQRHTLGYNSESRRATTNDAHVSNTNHETDHVWHGPSLAGQLAAFCRQVSWESLPARVQERARLHALDALGLALASHTQDYAAPALAGITAVAGPGECTLIGDERRLAPRDAALANGLLIH